MPSLGHCCRCDCVIPVLDQSDIAASNKKTTKKMKMLQSILLFGCLAFTNAFITKFIPTTEKELLSFLHLNSSDIHKDCIDGWRLVESTYAAVENRYPGFTTPNLRDGWGMRQVYDAYGFFSIQLENSTCAALSIPRYILDSLHFITLKFYFHRHGCLSQPQVEVLYIGCSAEHDAQPGLYSKQFDHDGTLRMKSIVVCMISRMQCEDFVLEALWSGGFAGADLLGFLSDIKPHYVKALKNNVPHSMFNRKVYE
uniref:Uncharacterized protein n=1 Tax=Caenorhabditis japonica TaxID=281687 RepID=A0A8R1E1A3_CAEJA